MRLHDLANNVESKAHVCGDDRRGGLGDTEQRLEDPGAFRFWNRRSVIVNVQRLAGREKRLSEGLPLTKEFFHMILNELGQAHYFDNGPNQA